MTVFWETVYLSYQNEGAFWALSVNQRAEIGEAKELCKTNNSIGPRTKHASCPWINRDGNYKISHQPRCEILWQTTQENIGNTLKRESYLYLEDCNNPTMTKLIILENISNNPVAKAIANLFCISYLSTVSRALSQNSSDMNLLGRLRTHYLMWQIGEKLKYISRDRCGLFLQFWFIVLLTCLYVCIMLAALYEWILSDHCSGSCSCVSELPGHLKKTFWCNTVSRI